MPRTDPGLTEVLHEALRNEPSLAAIAREAGVQLSSVTRFVDRSRPSLSLATADALADALGLRLVAGRRKPAKARKP